MLRNFWYSELNAKKLEAGNINIVAAFFNFFTPFIEFAVLELQFIVESYMFAINSILQLVLVLF